MFKRALLAVALIVATVAASATPAQALFPPEPGEYLVVLSYYSNGDKTELIGQRWFGCPGQSGRWGATSSHITPSFPPCS
jgi:hypothetical protein